MADKDKTYLGHRQRVRERYLKEGNFDSFQEYEVLEMMLYYAYPQRDTKPVAKRLISLYGSLSAVLNTEPQRLMMEAKLTENVAVFLSMFVPVMRKHTTSYYAKGTKVGDFKSAYNILSGLMSAQKYESLYLLSLDIDKKLISSDRIKDGVGDEVQFSCEEVFKRAVLNDAKYAIIGHNHPAGINEPSEADVLITRKLIEGLSAVGVRLLDHIIICGFNYFSFTKEGYFGLSYKK